MLFAGASSIDVVKEQRICWHRSMACCAIGDTASSRWSWVKGGWMILYATTLWRERELRLLQLMNITAVIVEGICVMLPPRIRAAERGDSDTVQ